MVVRLDLNSTDFPPLSQGESIAEELLVQTSTMPER